MEKSALIKCLQELNLENIKGATYTYFLETQITEVYQTLGITYEDTISIIPEIVALNFSKEIDFEWKYVCLGFFIIISLHKESEKSNEIFLSVQETKDVKTFLRNIVAVGICTKLQPNLPFHVQSKYYTSEDIFWNYNVLKCTTFGLSEFLKLPFLRLLILPENLKEILVALYQICYCPLKKPTGDTTSNKNVITTDIYDKLVQEQKFFVQILNHLQQTTHPQIYVRETMVILHKNSPVWFKKQVSHNLTTILHSKNGVQTVALALFSDQESNNTQNWKILDIFSKLILSCRKFTDFKDNICKQLINFVRTESHDSSIAEHIFAHFTKVLYPQDVKLCRSVFIRELLTPFLHFTYKSHKFHNENLTEKISWTSRLLHAVFVENSSEIEALPIVILKPVINVLFRFYVLTQTSFKTLNNDLKDLLILYLENQQIDCISIFDTILFNIESKDILPFRNDIVLVIEKNNIVVNVSEHSVQYLSSEQCDSLFKLLKNNSNLLVLFFAFLLNCITNECKYFPKCSEALIEIEEELTGIYFERKIVVYKLLSELAEEKNVQKQLNDNPYSIIEYMNKVLKKTIHLKTHLSDDYDSEGYQSVFTILMILENLLTNTTKIDRYEVLVVPLKQIFEETGNKETKDLIKTILDMLLGVKTSKTTNFKEETKTELDKVIDDVCDSLLPTRGHGLICLTKLIEKKDEHVMERKQFVLNILQQNISNEDSFIYLSAINGLAAMADIFPDTILNILCEEYSDSSRKKTEDCSEVRMKLGEVLVKVSKILGDMAPKYKPLLLNTFLVGAKNDDDLIRSSSLSNLGEICRVLGYKLGSMFTEVLVCVHAIITTDKSPQARRAAVTVIRQLFIGLDQDIISFFKEEILPVYRSLKQIYNNDKDDVMRLQAQLALEELNESMKNFVFPNPQLNFEKKIVMLD